MLQNWQDFHVDVDHLRGLRYRNSALFALIILSLIGLSFMRESWSVLLQLGLLALLFRTLFTLFYIFRLSPRSSHIKFGLDNIEDEISFYRIGKIQIADLRGVRIGTTVFSREVCLVFSDAKTFLQYIPIWLRWWARIQLYMDGPVLKIPLNLLDGDGQSIGHELKLWAKSKRFGFKMDKAKASSSSDFVTATLPLSNENRTTSLSTDTYSSTVHPAKLKAQHHHKWGQFLLEIYDGLRRRVRPVEISDLPQEKSIDGIDQLEFKEVPGISETIGFHYQRRFFQMVLSFNEKDDTRGRLEISVDQEVMAVIEVLFEVASLELQSIEKFIEGSWTQLLPSLAEIMGLTHSH